MVESGAPMGAGRSMALICSPSCELPPSPIQPQWPAEVPKPHGHFARELARKGAQALLANANRSRIRRGLAGPSLAVSLWHLSTAFYRSDLFATRPRPGLV